MIVTKLWRIPVRVVVGVDGSANEAPRKFGNFLYSSTALLLRTCMFGLLLLAARHNILNRVVGYSLFATKP